MFLVLVFATSEEMVQHALHPQLAELQEETAAGKQTFTDFLMRGNRYARYVKKERLAQAQNENRRKIFFPNLYAVKKSIRTGQFSSL